ncbi:MAG: NusG domain II-containing protein [Clostridia bacterium]|nr:NusG domain II-containing protein [Clostridia bacterium]
MKKGDIVIIGAVAAAFVLSVALLLSFSKQGSHVVIKQDNKIIYNKSININETIDTGKNTVIIKDGVVYISDATCKNQVCVNTGKISQKGESIVCLPNRVIVEIE